MNSESRSELTKLVIVVLVGFLAVWALVPSAWTDDECPERDGMRDEQIREVVLQPS